MKRQLKAGVGATALLAAAASVAIIGGTETAHSAGTPSSAFGITLSLAGNEVIPPTPYVISEDGTDVSDSLIGLPENPVASGGVVNASAGDAVASASVTDLAVGDGLLSALPAELTTELESICTQLSTALEPVTDPVDTQVVDTLTSGLSDTLDAIADATTDSPIDLGALGALDLSQLTDLQLEGLCDVLAGNLEIVGAGVIEAECTGTTGTTTITDLMALGLPVDVGVDEVNQKVEIPGLLTLTINEQYTNADGTFTVNALHVELLGQVDLVVASATCGDFIPDGTEAPSPTPVETKHPVTG